MTELNVRESGSAATHRRPSERIRDAESLTIKLPVVGQLRLPRADHLAFYGGLVALSALQILDWPMALVLGAGQVLAEGQHSRLVQGFGDALGDA